MFSYKFLGNKLLHLFLVFLGVSIVTFAISHVIPGDPARMLVGRMLPLRRWRRRASHWGSTNRSISSTSST